MHRVGVPLRTFGTCSRDREPEREELDFPITFARGMKLKVRGVKCPGEVAREFRSTSRDPRRPARNLFHVPLSLLHLSLSLFLWKTTGT